MPDEKTSTTPADDVDHDEAAMRDAEEKMHATGTGSDNDPDPEGGHDPEALEEAAERMGTKR